MNVSNQSPFTRWVEVAGYPVGTAYAITISFTIGLAYAIYLLGPSVAFGAGDFWHLPRTWDQDTDIRISLSGYYWFVQDAWRWPLMHISGINGPRGTNAALFDVAPVLALAGKVIRSLSGTVVNLFPLWLTATFVLNAIAAAMLVRAMGLKTVLGTIVAATMGAVAPVVHHRMVHLFLMQHWVFVFAMAYSIASMPRAPLRLRQALPMLGLCLLAVSMNLYLYVMTAAVAAAFFLQAAVQKSSRSPVAVAGLAAVPIIGVALLWCFGVLAETSTMAQTIPFGVNSMNLLAPFWPQASGAFQWTGLYVLTRGSIGATRGQYEGYCYLGIGVLILLAVALPANVRRLPDVVRRHWGMALALAVLTIWSVSNKVYLGAALIAEYPVPDILLRTVLAWFRSSGRFFWPVMWVLLGLGIAGALRTRRPVAGLALAGLVLGLQWIDLSVWRDRVQAATAAAAPSVFGSAEAASGIEALIARRGSVTAIPSFYCSAKGANDYSSLVARGAIEVQLMAARMNVPMTGLSLARASPDCPAERSTPLVDAVGTGVLVTLPDDGPFDRRAEAQATLACTPAGPALVCVGRP